MVRYMFVFVFVCISHYSLKAFSCFPFAKNSVLKQCIIFYETFSPSHVLSEYKCILFCHNVNESWLNKNWKNNRLKNRSKFLYQTFRTYNNLIPIYPIVRYLLHKFIAPLKLSYLPCLKTHPTLCQLNLFVDMPQGFH